MLTAENIIFSVISEEMTAYERNEVLHEDRNWRYWKESKEAGIQVNCGDVKKNIKIFTDKYNAYSGKHNFLCNIGYQVQGNFPVTLTLPLKTREYIHTMTFG